MSAAALASASPESSPIRGDAADAWRRAGAMGAHLMVCADGHVLTRLHDSAAPGTMCYADGGRPVLTRPKLSLDGNLDLITDATRSARCQPGSDAPLSDRARDQLRSLRPRLSALDPRKFGANGFASADGTVRTPQSDAVVARALFQRHGVEDLVKLQAVLGLCPEATRTVSRLAAADDMTDLFLGTELVAMSTDLIRVEHRRPYARELLPMRSLNAPGALAYESQTFDRKGRAEHTQNFRGRPPTATVTRESKLRPLVWIRSGMTWSWLELQQWQQARSNGAPLPDFVTEQRDAAREADLELENIDLMFGNVPLGILGILSPGTGIPTPAAIANPADAATPEAAVQVYLTGAKLIFETEVEQAEVIAVSTRDYLYATTTAYDSSNSNGESIADVVLKRGKSMGIKAFIRIPELGWNEEVETYLLGLGYGAAEASAYAGGIGEKHVILTMSRNPRKLRGVIGQDLMQLPPDRTSSETFVQVCMSTGGVEVLFPKSAHIQKVDDPTP